MVERILILVLVASLAQASDYLNGHRFSCNTQDLIREVRNAKDTLKRVFHQKNRIYMVFENRILYMKEPDSHPTEDPLRPHLIQSNIFEIRQRERQLSELGIPGGYRVMGYVHDEKTDRHIELYSTEGQRQIGGNRILDFAYLMSFNSKLPPGARTQRMKIKDMWTYFWLNNPEPAKWTAEQLLTFSGATKYIEINDGNLHKWAHNWFVTYSYRYMDLELCHTYWNILETAFCRKFVNEEYKWLKSFATYLTRTSADAKKGVVQFDWHVFGVEEDHAILLIHYRFKAANYHELKGHYTIESNVDIRWNFDDLLSCHTPWSDPRQLKGVYYHKRSKIFYVFIKRFYLKIQDELVQNGFELDNDLYVTHAYDIEYEDDKLYEEMYFDMAGRKFIKTFPTTVYYMPSSNLYDMSLTDKDLIKIPNRDARVKYKIYIYGCHWQILVVDKRFIYCFKSSHYFLIQEMNNENRDYDRKLFATHKIFEDLNIGYLRNQSLEFTFNYGDDQIAFLTTTDLWLFNYDGFHQEPDLSLTYTDKHVRLRNCYFAKCAPATSSEGPPATTESTTTTRKPITQPRPIFTTPSGTESPQTTKKKPSQKRLNDLYLFLIIFGAFFLIAALVYTCFAISKRNSFDEGLSRREVRLFRNIFRRGFRRGGRPAPIRQLNTMPSYAHSQKPSEVSSFALPPSTQLVSKPSSSKPSEVTRPSSPKKKLGTRKR